MTPNGTRVVKGAGWLEVHPQDVVLICGDDPDRRALAAVKLSERTWVALGETPPEGCSRTAEAQAAASVAVHRNGPSEVAPLADGGWPPEPPPDVDSEA